MGHSDPDGQSSTSWGTGLVKILLPVSFVVLIAVGTVLLMLPAALAPGHSLTFVDAVFTATSAVCVTGLSVRTPTVQFTPLGQGLLGLLIQLGGLGIMIFGGLCARAAGLFGRAAQPRRIVWLIVVWTVGIELLGAAILFPLWSGDQGAAVGMGRRAALSIFHSVSAFCNAGFDLSDDRLSTYRYGMLIHAVVLPLVIVGGLGFGVLFDMARVVRARLGRVPREQEDLHLHSKVVLLTTACLYLYGVLAVGSGQLLPYFHASFDQGITAHVERPGPVTGAVLGRILADASLLSVTARTAGFSPLLMDELEPAGRFAVSTLMFAGGSAGSAAAGLTTSVVAVLVMSLAASIRRKDRAALFGVTIAEAFVRKAAVLCTGLIALIAGSTLLLSMSEPYPFEKLIFEVVSAASTTGLSLGITADLTGFGKAVIIATMFLGRVGPLALLGAMVLEPD